MQTIFFCKCNLVTSLSNNPHCRTKEKNLSRLLKPTFAPMCIEFMFIVRNNWSHRKDIQTSSRKRCINTNVDDNILSIIDNNENKQFRLVIECKLTCCFKSSRVDSWVAVVWSSARLLWESQFFKGDSNPSIICLWVGFVYMLLLAPFVSQPLFRASLMFGENKKGNVKIISLKNGVLVNMDVP